jgi:hypothetical protein
MPDETAPPPPPPSGTTLQDVLDLVPESWPAWGAPLLLAVVVLLVLRGVVRGARRRWRRGRGPAIHPNLQKYNVDHTELDRVRRERAGRIAATSTGARLAGFRIVRQVEAVFVEGFRTPDEALLALKAEAVERGANAILNVSTERTAAGRCTASGDAIVAEPIASRRGPDLRAGAKPTDPPRGPDA